MTAVTPHKTPSPQLGEPFLRSVRIQNYKSIGNCYVKLGRLTVLVGRNGAGKSNFLDALRFITDGLQFSLDHALKYRGGIKAVRRHSTGHPRNFAIRVSFNLPGWRVGTYGFEIAAKSEGGFVVKQEKLLIVNANNTDSAHYQVDMGEVSSRTHKNLPPVLADRLYLVNAAGLPGFREAYDALVAMGFYNLNPESMKELQSPDAGELLHRDGSNIASVIARLEREHPDVKKRIELFLSTIVPGVLGAERKELGPRETVEFRQKVVGAEHAWRFLAANMSDGTLRALGILVAVQQRAGRAERVRLVGIEKPETALHPAAAQAVMDALNEAISHTQIIITTHSADLLDAITEPMTILAVELQQGETRLAPIDAASEKAMQDHLYNAGELLRMDQFSPDPDDLKRQSESPLFDVEEVRS